MQLEGKNIAVIATDGFEDDELTKPVQSLRDAGATVHIVSDKDEMIVGEHDTEVSVDVMVDEVNSQAYDGLLIPGGVGNPDNMRMNVAGVAFVRSFFDDHKPVAAICHGPWLLVEADVLKGRTVTSWASLKTDLKNAGAIWVDEEVVVDQGLVTSRNPNDLPAFTAKMIEEFAEGEHESQTV